MMIKMAHSDTLSCESILRKAANGDLFIVSQCGGNTEPNILNRVFLFRSTDGGETWDKGYDIYPMSDKAVYQTEVMVIDDVIYVFLVTHNGCFLDWETFIISSKDNGYSFKYEMKAPFFDKFVFFRGMIETASGDIVIPYQRYIISEEENKQLKSQNKMVWDCKNRFAELGVIISRDRMKTFEHHSAGYLPFIEKLWNWAENTIVELDSSHIVMLVRRDGQGVLSKTESFDGGITWSEFEKTSIPNPNNKPKLIKLNKEKIALINTPCSQPNFLNRNPLEIWISNNKMKNWDKKYRITDFPGVFSYPDGIALNNGNEIAFSFDYNRHDIFFVKYVVE